MTPFILGFKLDFHIAFLILEILGILETGIYVINKLKGPVIYAGAYYSDLKNVL